MDVEEYARKKIAGGESEETVQEKLVNIIRCYKTVEPSYASAFARAVIDEVKNTRGLTGDFFAFEPAGVKMGEFGVGSRGKGDFFAHRQIARIIGKSSASVGVDQMDDGGAVRAGGEYIVCTVDGMHSRLSDYPFLAGFHVTRATLRDAMVMGAKPVMLFSDIHVADDGDVAKIFDYTAGITTVGEAMDVPLVTGFNTPHRGGHGAWRPAYRLCGCVGVTEHLTARKVNAGRRCAPHDGRCRRRHHRNSRHLLGISGGRGTDHQPQFPHRLRDPDEERCLYQIHAMTDVTNGGLRGDIYEMAETAQCRIVIDDTNVAGLVEPHVGQCLRNCRSITSAYRSMHSSSLPPGSCSGDLPHCANFAVYG